MVRIIEDATSKVNVKIVIQPCGTSHCFDIHRETLRNVKDKASFTVVLRDLYHDRKEAVLFSYSKLSFSRRSKKRQGIIPLQTDRDFHEMHRSLTVKDHLSLYVNFEVAGLFQYLISTIYQINRFEPNKRSLFDVPTRFDVIRRLEGFSCNSCNPGKYFRDIEGVRYKCSVCHDVDLCSPCFQLGSEVSHHKRSHPMIQFQNLCSGSKHGDSSLDHEVGVKIGKENDISFSPDEYLNFESVLVPPMSQAPELAIRVNRLLSGILKLSLKNLASEPFRTSKLSVELEDLNGNLKASTVRDSCFILPSMSVDLIVKGNYVAPGEKLRVALLAPDLYAKLFALDIDDISGLKSDLYKASHDDDSSIHNGEDSLSSSPKSLSPKQVMPAVTNGLSKLCIGDDEPVDELLFVRESELVNQGDLDDYDVLSLSDLSED